MLEAGDSGGVINLLLDPCYLVPIFSPLISFFRFDERFLYFEGVLYSS